ncbi:MAG: prenyltransferase/squalene oxidase repeat-containing protein, partial [Limisphaerales bacterium]
RRVRPLPFELAVLPRGLFGALRLPVVSYALPALIAIGQVIHHRAKRFHPLRTLARRRTLEVLTSLQPAHGGFLEATPLTSFVTMSLAGMGEAQHVVARRGVAFLSESVRPDGNWPIDTNLATWVTTLAIGSLSETDAGGQVGVCQSLSGVERDRLRAWILGQQSRTAHPYTGAAPGGWAWTDLPGGVPDADDTAGALLALRYLTDSDHEVFHAAVAGVTWLLDLQNRDGGIPTFCRGWGSLPFDRSSPELTAHVLRSWWAWLPALPAGTAKRVEAAVTRAVDYLLATQRDDGAWLPLWFGNEAAPEKLNPVYGTAQVLAALTELDHSAAGTEAAVQTAARLLQNAQNPDGGWGGDRGVVSSIEETSLALAALLKVPGTEVAARRGLDRVLQCVENGTFDQPAPIGLYFARLWYFERLYPVIFTLKALRNALAAQGVLDGAPTSSARSL